MIKMNEPVGKIYLLIETTKFYNCKQSYKNGKMLTYMRWV